jgi:hypothetical protein
MKQLLRWFGGNGGHKLPEEVVQAAASKDEFREMVKKALVSGGCSYRARSQR